VDKTPAATLQFLFCVQLFVWGSLRGGLNNLLPEKSSCYYPFLRSLIGVGVHGFA